MRYLLGILLFGGFAMFVTPVTIVGMLASTEAPRHVMSLVSFGLGAAVIFGIPGYFAFPWERRLQAVAWLALACLAYGSFLVAALSLMKAVPALFSDPGARAFYEGMRFRYGYFAAVAIVEVAIFLALFRRERVADAAQAMRQGSRRRA